jgi:uncharacterized protein
MSQSTDEQRRRGSPRVHRILVIGDVRGASQQMDDLLQGLPEGSADTVVLVGDLAAPWDKPATYRAIFKALGAADLPAFWVPGPTDAPLREYLREAANIEVAYEHLHGVHGTVALAPGQVLFAGLGGEIVDDPDTVRDEEAVVKYPGWEAEYRLKVIRELDEHERVLVFSTPPAHRESRTPGSETVKELIGTYRPRIAIVAGEEPSERHLGRTLVVTPGRFDQGRYALIDYHERSVELVATGEPAAV